MVKDSGPKPKGLVEKVRDAAVAAKDAVVNAGSAIAEGLAATAADDAAASDQRVANAEAFSDRAEAQRARAAAADAALDYDRAKAGRVDGFKALPAEGPLALRFADGESFIDGARSVERGEVKVDGFGATYLRAVDFPADGEPHRITEAWLIAAGGSAVRCEIAGGMQVGAGQHGLLPSGFLLF